MLQLRVSFVQIVDDLTRIVQRAFEVALEPSSFNQRNISMVQSVADLGAERFKLVPNRLFNLGKAPNFCEPQFPFSFET